MSETPTNQPGLLDPGNRNHELVASAEELTELQGKIQGFVAFHGPKIEYPPGTPMLELDGDLPRPVFEDEKNPTVYVTLSGDFLRGVAPLAAELLDIGRELSFSDSVPTYSYIGDMPASTEDMDPEDIFDPRWSYGATRCFVINRPGGQLDSTSYNFPVHGGAGKETDPMPADHLVRSLFENTTNSITALECQAITQIIDTLEQLEPERLAAALEVSAELG